MPRLIPDWVWVVMTIRQEADSEPMVGKIAVAEVIRNRMMTGYNSDGTAAGTVLAPLQFSGWNTSDPNRKRIASINIEEEETINALEAYERAFTSHSALVLGANLYHAKTMPSYPVWTKDPKVRKITEIGNHIFYKEER